MQGRRAAGRSRGCSGATYLTEEKARLSDLAGPLVYRGPSRSRRCSAVSVSSAANAIGQVEKGCEILVLSLGDFSLSDVIQHLLDVCGPSYVDLATWTAAVADIRRGERLLRDGRILGWRLIVDPSFLARQPKYCQTMVECFGADSIRSFPLHSKFVLIRNESWNVVVRTSMNLNENRRMELVEISDDPDLCAFMGEVVDRVFETYSPEESFTTQAKGYTDRLRIGEATPGGFRPLPF